MTHNSVPDILAESRDLSLWYESQHVDAQVYCTFCYIIKEHKGHSLTWLGNTGLLHSPWCFSLKSHQFAAMMGGACATSVSPPRWTFLLIVKSCDARERLSDSLSDFLFDSHVLLVMFFFFPSASHSQYTSSMRAKYLANRRPEPNPPASV